MVRSSIRSFIRSLFDPSFGSSIRSSVRSAGRVLGARALVPSLAAGLPLAGALVGLAGLVGLGGAVGPAHAQSAGGLPSIAPSGGRIVARHGAWTVMCDTPPGAPAEQCGALQEVVSAERPDLGLTVLVFETADGADRVLRVVAPLNIFLPKGMGLNIDGQDLGRAVFARCVREGCQAEVVLDDALIERLGSGDLATFIIFQSPDRGTGFPLELEGFADAFAAAREDGAKKDGERPEGAGDAGPDDAGSDDAGPDGAGSDDE